MINYSLTLYKTGFRIDEHAIYDDLQTYLDSLAPSILTIAYFQFLKAENSLYRTVKIELDQQLYNDGLKTWDYCRYANPETNETLYYYITGIRWKSQSTAELSLELDYMNTNRDRYSLTSNTHVTRRYKDRWEKVSSTTWKPLIDRMPEDISQPQLHKDSSTALTKEKWYLVYISNNASEESAEAKPIICVCYGEKQHAIYTDKPSTFTIKPDTLESGKYYHALNSTNPFEAVIHWEIGAEEIVGSLSSTDYNGFDVYLKLSDDGNYIEMHKLVMLGGIIPKSVSLITKIKQIDFTNATFLYITDSTDYTKCDPDSTMSIGASSAAENSILPAFSTIYQQLKTQSLINKIIELPTAPFIFHETTLGELIVPAGWSVTQVAFANALLRDDYTQTLGNMFVDDLDDVVKYKNLAEYDTVTPYDLTLETKIYNSNYYQVKYVYDVNSYELMLEYGYDPVTITFEAAKEMSSNIMFKFDSDTPIYSDLGNYICSNRNLEVPIYTSDYLEYMRYGKYIDEKNMAYQILGQSMSVAGSAMQGVASSIVAGSMAKNSSLGGIGGTVSAVTSAAGLAISITKSVDQLNQKVEQNKRTANQSSTANDLSILNSTIGNQLNRITYVPDDYIKTSIQEYFRIYGYSADEYAIPTDTRYWNDYFVADIEFSKDSKITELMKSAISSQYSAGVRKYHYHNGYDLDKEYENWETSIK